MFSGGIGRLLLHHFMTHRQIMVKQEMISGPFLGDFICRHHVEPRVKLYMPKEESFPFPMKFIDVYQNNINITRRNVGENTDD